MAHVKWVENRTFLGVDDNGRAALMSGGDGPGVDPAKVERAIQLSLEKYCGAHATLRGVARIRHDFEVREVEPQAPGQV